jgi:signal transduction histidine kinase
MGRKRATVALLCYGLLVVATVVDFLTPQLFLGAILLNGPIALSSLALRRNLTMNLVVAAEIANAAAGYFNGLSGGRHWDGIAIADRLLLAASFVVVGALSVKSQEAARDAGIAASRDRQIQIERSLREAIARVRETLDVEIVQRAVVRESVALLEASRATLIVRESPLSAPLFFTYARDADDVAVRREALSTEMASLVTGATERQQIAWVRNSDLVGRMNLEALDAREAIVASIATYGTAEYVLVLSVSGDDAFAPDALPTLRAFSQQAAMALEQAHLFRQLGERSTEIARQKDELAQRNDVIRDIVYALAHDLRTPQAAAHVTMTQALAGAYGELPDRYREILRTAVAANHDQRRIVETLLLVARYEAGETSAVRERVSCADVARRVADELRPVADVKGVGVAVEAGPDELVVIADPHEIGRALANLLANAIEATPNGGHVTLFGSRSGTSLSVSVEDDGFGVPHAQRAGLFVRFGGNPRSGTGLGLYIVRRIAEKYGGSVAYEPREPSGSRFTLTLPAAPG